MLCNVCMVQMHQKDKIGGGRAEETEYTTWEFKECPACGRKVIEYYAAIEVTASEEVIIKEVIKLKTNEIPKEAGDR